MSLLENSLGRHELVKDFEMERLPWLIQVGSKCQHSTCILISEGQREIYTQKKRGQCAHGSRNWNGAVTNQGMQADPRCWKTREQILPSSLWREDGPVYTSILAQ